jgi:hypothetical protein
VSYRAENVYADEYSAMIGMNYPLVYIPIIHFFLYFIIFRFIRYGRNLQNAIIYSIPAAVSLSLFFIASLLGTISEFFQGYEFWSGLLYLAPTYLSLLLLAVNPFVAYYLNVGRNGKV